MMREEYQQRQSERDLPIFLIVSLFLLSLMLIRLDYQIDENLLGKDHDYHAFHFPFLLVYVVIPTERDDR